jgi:hypothetical protein
VSLWETRDYPVLRAIADSDDNDLLHGFLQLGGGQAGERLGLQLSDEEIYTSVLVLGDADYLTGEMNPETGNNAFFTKLRVTGAGQQALGEWPLFGDPSPATLAAFLEQLADEAPTPDEAENARRASRFVKALSREALRATGRTVVVEATKATVRALTS